MTLEEILKCSADQLEAMTPQELEEHFKQYFPITRPEKVAKLPTSKQPTTINPKLAQAQAMFEKLGLDVDINSTLAPIRKKR